ncbi:MAG TPA: lysylphosphatidylglycerol synthase transmembrane domain-containing protein, partial [Candidatus Saccharimonadales bacterium]|nr:lysylphosphatidylglycerol synthase transmembrane domain-containing protein [Candidatus Saccharimonadales bacterium]
MHPDERPKSASTRSWRSIIPKWLRHSLLVFLILLIVEYLVIPELVGASKNLHLLRQVNIAWLIAGIGLEAGAIVCYAQLTRTLLPRGGPGLFKLVRIVLATSAVAHVIPGGAAGGAGVGYRLLTSNGVEGADAGFAMATEAIGSALVLNVMLWFALLISIPLAGLHPIYVVTALVGLLALFGAAILAYALTRGGERAVRVVRSVGRRIPRVGADRLERLVRQVGDSVIHLAQDREVLKRALLWAGLNWLFDAASLWSFVSAFGHFVDPVELFAAYGIANVLGAIPIT